MNKQVSLEELWKSASSVVEVFQSEQLKDLPVPARRYLEYAIAPVTKLACAVRLYESVGFSKIHTTISFVKNL